ncbi:MAG: hypothetical protein STSR0007_13230 [Thermovirga sp.]
MVRFLRLLLLLYYGFPRTLWKESRSSSGALLQRQTNCSMGIPDELEQNLAL